MSLSGEERNDAAAVEQVQQPDASSDGAQQDAVQEVAKDAPGDPWQEADRLLEAERPKDAGDQKATEQPDERKPADSAAPVAEDPEIVLDNGRKVKLSQIRQWEGAHSKFTETQQALARERDGLKPLSEFQKYIRDPKNERYAKAISDLLEAQKLEAYLQWAEAQGKPATTTAKKEDAPQSAMEQDWKRKFDEQNARLAEQQKVIDEWRQEKQAEDYKRQFTDLFSSRPELKDLPDQEKAALRKKLVNWMAKEIDEGHSNITVDKAYRYHAFDSVAEFMSKKGAAQQQVREQKKREAGGILPGTGNDSGQIPWGQRSQEERDAELLKDATDLLSHLGRR